MTREDWLTVAIEKLKPSFSRLGHEIPSVRVSVGFPGGSRPNARKTIGQYWHAEAATDSVPQVFISPVLTDKIQILETLVHELVHACTPGTGHKAPFKRLAMALGLTGKMTATVAGPALRFQLEALASELGDFEHGGLNWAMRKKQSTRMLKLECTGCGFVCRASRTAIDDYGLPTCNCGDRLNEASND